MDWIRVCHSHSLISASFLYVITLVVVHVSWLLTLLINNSNFCWCHMFCPACELVWILCTAIVPSERVKLMFIQYFVFFPSMFHCSCGFFFFFCSRYWNAHVFIIISHLINFCIPFEEASNQFNFEAPICYKLDSFIVYDISLNTMTMYALPFL